MSSEPTLTRDVMVRARKRLLRMHFECHVGHIGGNLSALDALMTLYHRVLVDDDLFILSKGHAAGALYVTLWSLGRMTDAELSTFHGEGTRLSGHPTSGKTNDIRFATGSLGHGLSLAAGSALGARLRGVDGRVFCLMSDGEWQEGSTWEALIFACHHRLKNLTMLVDQNGLQGFGTTDEVASMAPLRERLKGFDLDIEIVNGHDVEAIEAAVARGSERPRCVILQTVKGRGVSFMEHRVEWHYRVLDADLYRIALSEVEA